MYETVLRKSSYGSSRITFHLSRTTHLLRRNPMKQGRASCGTQMGQTIGWPDQKRKSPDLWSGPISFGLLPPAFLETLAPERPRNRITSLSEIGESNLTNHRFTEKQFPPSFLALFFCLNLFPGIFLPFRLLRFRLSWVEIIFCSSSPLHSLVSPG